MPQSQAEAAGSAFLLPADGTTPALALGRGETWIGRGSFPCSPAAQLRCSRRQACVEFTEAGLKITCHGLNPLHFRICQDANFHASAETEVSALWKLGRGESSVLSNGDVFYLFTHECLLRVVVEPHTQLPCQTQISAPLENFHPSSEVDAFVSSQGMQLPAGSDSLSTQRQVLAGGFRNLVPKIGAMLSDMQPVVATITGYEGQQRINLIKLISRTGAAFTGNCTSRNTHLVCWKFSGPKYEMAKKFSHIIVLNHRWFEDCLSSYCRQPEEAYTLQSGQEVGPCLWRDSGEVEAPIAEITTASHSGSDRKGKRILDLTEAEGAGPSRHQVAAPERRSDMAHAASDAGPSMVHQVDVQVDVPQGVVVDTGRGQTRSTTRLHSPRPVERRPKSRRLVRKTSSNDSQQWMDDIGGGGSSEMRAEARNVIDLRSPSPPMHPRDENHMSGSPNYRMCGAGAGTPVNCSVIPPLEAQVCTEVEAAKQRGSPGAELACVICYADKAADKEGRLGCGHHFCFLCIYKWALEARSKDPMCPLCKAPFVTILKQDRRRSSDKCGASEDEVVFAGPRQMPAASRPTRGRFCINCGNTDSPDLLLTCCGCHERAVHLFCMDPPNSRVDDNWFCPRCYPQRRRSEFREQWQRLLPGTNVEGDGTWYLQTLDLQPLSRGNDDMVGTGRTNSNPRTMFSPTISGTNRTRMMSGSRQHGRARQRSISTFFVRRSLL